MSYREDAQSAVGNQSAEIVRRAGMSAPYCKAEEQRQAIPDLFAAEELEASA